MQSVHAAAHKTPLHAYHPGGLIKVLTRVLQPLCRGVLKLAPRFIGPFLIVATPFPDVVQVQLPDSYKFVHSTFKGKYVRSLLAHADQEFDPRYPVVEAHPSLIPAIAVLDLRMIARTIPRRLSQTLPSLVNI